MSQENRCLQCGADLTAGAVGGLCAKCLTVAGTKRDDFGQPSTDGREAVTTPHAPGFVPPAPGSLAPHFPQLEIVELLGHGGMGAVYKARQPKLDRMVALKIIRPESADTPAFAERFNREARLLARLSHPHIVTLHDFGDVEVSGSVAGGPSRRLYYILMEYVDGANLRQLMRAGDLAPEQALAIVPQICEALQFAHDEGIVHRDIKPENILLDKRGRAKIADFGLAKLTSQSPEDIALTGTHQMMGTLRYMAPEQMDGARAVDHRADIYSLGVVFYEMLTGEIPAGHFDPPSKKVEVDVRLDEVVLRALARDPQRRYQHASDIKSDVESISHDQKMIPPLAGGSAAPFKSRSLLGWIGLVAMVVVPFGLVTAFGISSFLWKRDILVKNTAANEIAGDGQAHVKAGQPGVTNGVSGTVQFGPQAVRTVISLEAATGAGPEIAPVQTDENGRFTFTKVPHGSYVLKAKTLQAVDNYIRTGSVEISVPTPPQKLHPVTIRLR